MEHPQLMKSRIDQDQTSEYLLEMLILTTSLVVALENQLKVTNKEWLMNNEY